MRAKRDIGKMKTRGIAKEKLRRRIENVSRLNIDSAKLKLAMLKENLQYRKLFEKLRSNVETLGPLPNLSFKFKQSKTQAEMQEKIQEMEELSRRKDALFPAGDSLREQLYDFGIQHIIPFLLRCPRETIILLDPDQDFEKAEFLDSEATHEALQRMFLRVGIYQLEPIDRGAFENPLGVRFGLNNPLENLEPYERILKIDLRSRPSDLMKAFKSFLDAVRFMKTTWVQGKDEGDRGYNHWNLDDSRARKESKEELKVWNLRMKHLRPFAGIASELGISLQLTKDRFYSIYEKTQGKKYVKGDWFKLRNTKLYQGKPFSFCKKCQEACLGEELCPMKYEPSFQKKMLQSDFSEGFNMKQEENNF